MAQIEYWIEDRAISLEVDGDVHCGGPDILLDSDDDLTAASDWAELGYCVAPFLSDDEYAQLVLGIQKLLLRAMDAAGIDTDDSFTLSRYHHCVTDAQHAKVVEQTRGLFPLAEFPLEAKVIADRISQICNASVWPADPINKTGGFTFRVVRPHQNDNNPPHRDVWLDRLRNAVNIYVPLAGSTKLSSLPILPGSHRWPECDLTRTVAGAKVAGSAYTVPAVVATGQPFRLICPNPAPNEVLVFSPYLIHGGAANHNPDDTRVSLEMRFFRKSLP